MAYVLPDPKVDWTVRLTNGVRTEEGVGMRGARIVISTSECWYLDGTFCRSLDGNVAGFPLVWVAEAGVAGAYAIGVLVLLRISVTWLRSWKAHFSHAANVPGSASAADTIRKRGRRVRRRRTCSA